MLTADATLTLSQDSGPNLIGDRRGEETFCVPTTKQLANTNGDDAPTDSCFFFVRIFKNVLFELIEYQKPLKDL